MVASSILSACGLIMSLAVVSNTSSPTTRAIAMGAVNRIQELAMRREELDKVTAGVNYLAGSVALDRAGWAIVVWHVTPACIELAGEET